MSTLTEDEEGHAFAGPAVDPHEVLKALDEGTVRGCLVAARDAIDHALTHLNIIPTDMLIAVTEQLDEHPEGWEWPCACKECCSYG